MPDEPKGSWEASNTGLFERRATSGSVVMRTDISGFRDYSVRNGEAAADFLESAIQIVRDRVRAQSGHFESVVGDRTTATFHEFTDDSEVAGIDCWIAAFRSMREILEGFRGLVGKFEDSPPELRIGLSGSGRRGFAAVRESSQGVGSPSRVLGDGFASQVSHQTDDGPDGYLLNHHSRSSTLCDLAGSFGIGEILNSMEDRLGQLGDAGEDVWSAYQKIESLRDTLIEASPIGYAMVDMACLQDDEMEALEEYFDSNGLIRFAMPSISLFLSTLGFGDKDHCERVWLVIPSKDAPALSTAFHPSS